VVICEQLPSQESIKSVELVLEDSPKYELEAISIPNYKEYATVEPVEEPVIEMVSPPKEIIDKQSEILSSFTYVPEEKREPVVEPIIEVSVQEEPKS
jgi:hypothetical protein